MAVCAFAVQAGSDVCAIADGVSTNLSPFTDKPYGGLTRDADIKVRGSLAQIQLTRLINAVKSFYRTFSGCSSLTNMVSLNTCTNLNYASSICEGRVKLTDAILPPPPRQTVIYVRQTERKRCTLLVLMLIGIQQ